MKKNACWELRPSGQAICRWMISWVELDSARIAGAVTGYSGGGSFEVERFFGTLNSDVFDSLWIDCKDKILNKEIYFDALPNEILLACEAALDVIWEYNDTEIWNETDNVALKEELIGSSNFIGDLFLINDDRAAWLKDVCELSGLTAHPT